MGGVSHNKGGLSQKPIIFINPPGLIKTGKPLWYAPGAYCNGEGLMKTLHRFRIRNQQLNQEWNIYF